MIDNLKQYAKFIAAILGVILSTGAGLIPAEWAPWLQLVVAVLGAVAVYAVPNTPKSELPDNIQASFDSADKFIAQHRADNA